MPLQRIADLSGHIVVANVASVQSYWAENPRRIETRVTLTNAEFLKGGDAAQRTLSFTVPGGTVDTWQARVSGAPEFNEGERWALCLLPAWRSFPTAGIHQGGFRLMNDGGVQDGRGATVTALDSGGYIVTKAADSRMQTDAFLDALRAVAAASTPVELPPNAPVRIIPTYQPTSLIAAPGSPSGHTQPPNGVEPASTTSRESAP